VAWPFPVQPLRSSVFSERRREGEEKNREKKKRKTKKKKKDLAKPSVFPARFRVAGPGSELAV